VGFFGTGTKSCTQVVPTGCGKIPGCRKTASASQSAGQQGRADVFAHKCLHVRADAVLHNFAFTAVPTGQLQAATLSGHDCARTLRHVRLPGTKQRTRQRAAGVIFRPGPQNTSGSSTRAKTSRW